MGALDPAAVTACLVTRGDVDLAAILETLPYGEIIVWDNSDQPQPPEWWSNMDRPPHVTWCGGDDWKCAGRYRALLYASSEVVYFQDDDVIFRDHDALLDAFEPGRITAVWAHGSNPDGYDDVALVGAGALVPRALPWLALDLYLDHHPLDDGFRYEADFIVGALTPHEQIHLPFEIRDVAYNGRRLADQPWQRELKKEITDMARALR